MDLRDILRRTVQGHALVIATCSLLPLGVVLAMEAQSPQLWEATVRIQTVGPPAAADADAPTSQVQALASTPAVVAQALGPGSRRDPAAVAEQVDVRGLGAGPVVELVVTNSDADEARRTASALAITVTQVVNSANRAGLERQRTDVSTRLDAAVATRDGLLDQLRGVRGERNADTLKSVLDAAQRQVDHLQDEAAALSLAAASRTGVRAVAPGRPAVEKVPSTVVSDSAVALLVGLLVGLLAAALAEAWRPRIGGIRVLTGALGAPLLGCTTDRPTALEISMSLTARRQGVETVVMVGSDDRDERIVRHMLPFLPTAHHARGGIGVIVQSQLPPWPTGTTPPPGEHMVPDPTYIRVGFTDLRNITTADEVAAGVVVVASGTTRRTNVDALQDLLRALHWPVVGVIENTPRRRRTVTR